MKIYFILSMFVYIYYILYKSKKYMHMLQQNWYNDGNRYLKWILNNLSNVFVSIELLIILFLIIPDKFSIYAFIILYIIGCFILKNNYSKEQSKKPLVITARIKRLFIAMLLLYLILFILLINNYSDNSVNLLYFILGIFCYLNPFVIFISNIINKPIEKMVFNYYKRKAKSKLNSMLTLKRVAITGSYGKTSTKNILNTILNVKFNSFATEKSFNTMNGLMISINNKLDKFSDIFIAEMGAFKRGEIKEKCEFFEPKYGILTTIGEAHLESFESRENVCKAKFELVESLPEDGVAILNMDDEYQENYNIKSKCKKVWISIKNKKADVYASDIELSSKGMTFTCTFSDSKEKLKLTTRLLGFANVYNILQAVALSYEFGLTLEEIAIGVSKILPTEHRLELKKYNDINIIDDAYNSNPIGSSMALDVLNMMEGKKIIVTPGMIELGEKQYEYNKEFGKHIAKVCDEVILIGKKQTKPIMDGLKEEKYNEENIHILNDVKKAFPLIKKLSGKVTYALLENDLPDIFNE